MESLLNTVQESQYPMMAMDQAIDLACLKARELHLSKFADNSVEIKAID